VNHVALATAATLPAAWYLDESTYEVERRGVFARSWLVFAFAHQLIAPGDYVAADIAGFPIFVRRHEDGLQGFVNVCPHRAGPIVWPGSGQATNLVCRYHGWAFDGAGALRSARDFGGDVPNGLGLRPVRVATWRGIVFVNLDPDAEGLEALLADLPTMAAAFPMESYQHHSQVVHRMAANWKAYADNYLEGYHIPLMHPVLNQEVDTRRYEVTVHAGGRWHQHHVPARDGAPAVGAWAYVWPNLALNLYPDGMSVERFLPRGAREVDVVLDYFFADVTAAGVAGSVASSERLMDEDRRVVEAVQRNLAAGTYIRGVLSPRHEHGVAAFQRLVREAVATA
jgi:choline monooxygenase